MRGSAAAVIVPKPGEVRLLSTSLKFVWLNTLKNSARNTADMPLPDGYPFINHEVDIGQSRVVKAQTR